LTDRAIIADRPFRWRRAVAETALLATIGYFMGVLGPYGSDIMPSPIRYIYWEACILGGGVIGVTLDEVAARRSISIWPRLALTSLLMTPAVTAWVLFVQSLIVDQPMRMGAFFALLWQVFVVSLGVMAFRALMWRAPKREVEVRTIVEPPLPEAEAAFRRRLSAKRRTARLIAIEAEDHYLRVHTDAGSELVSMRFADALVELASAHGHQTHRSWWVAAGAIETVRWKRGVGEARLAGDLVAPVSRTYAPALRAAGWF
jgi:hypothetical protein